MKREDIEEIQNREADSPDPWDHIDWVMITEKERDELCRLALQATEPGVVVVPRDQLQRLYKHTLESVNESTEAFNVFLDMKEAKVFFPDN